MRATTAEDEQGVVVMSGAYPPGPDSLAALRAEAVIVGTVTRSELGPPTGPDDDPLYPVYVHLAVDKRLGASSDVPDMLVLWAQYVDAAERQYVAEGRPWLNPGDRVLTTVVPDDTEPELYGIRGLWTTYEIVDGRLSLPDRVIHAHAGPDTLPPLAEELLSMTEDEAVAALSR